MAAPFKLYFDAWDKGSPNGTSLGEVTEARDKRVQDQHNGVGLGHFVINRLSSQASMVAAGNVIRVRIVPGGPFAYNDSRYKFAFVIEEAEGDIVSQDGEGGLDWTRQGRGIIVFLERLVWYNESFMTDDGSSPLIRDYDWQFPEGDELGHILQRMIGEWNARSPSPRPTTLTKDFNQINDSAGNAWQTIAGDFTIPIGERYLSTIDTLVEADIDVHMKPSFQLQAWNEDGRGTDKSATVVFRKGWNIRESGSKKVHAAERPTRALVKGNSEDGPVYVEVTDGHTSADESGDYGRRETYVEWERTKNPTFLGWAGKRALKRLRRWTDGPPTIGVTSYDDVRKGSQSDGGSPAAYMNKVPWTDYEPGDIVTIDIPGEYAAVSARIVEITVNDDDTGHAEVSITFDDVPFNPTHGDSSGMGLSGGTGGGTTGGGRCCHHTHPVPHGPDPGTPGTACDVSFDRAWDFGADGLYDNSVGDVTITQNHTSHLGVDSGWNGLYNSECPQDAWGRMPVSEGGVVRFVGQVSARANSMSTRYVVCRWFVSTSAVTEFASETKYLPASNKDGWVSFDLSFIAPAGALGAQILIDRQLYLHPGVQLTAEDCTSATPAIPAESPQPIGNPGDESIGTPGLCFAYCDHVHAHGYLAGDDAHMHSYEQVVQHETTAAVDPAVTDDGDAGFIEGWKWINEADDKIFFLVDSTPGAAVWQEMGAGGGGAGHTIKNNGTPLTARAGLNFVPPLVATDDAGNNETDVDVDRAEDADISTQAFGDSPAAGANTTEIAMAGHKHGMPANPVTQSAVMSVLDIAEDADISTQAFGDSAAAGANVTEVAMAGHKHGMPANPVSTNLKRRGMKFRVSGFGSVVATGTVPDDDLIVPWDGTIVGWEIIANESGSVQVDLWKDTRANHPPTVADTITGSAKPLLSSAIQGGSTTLTGWNPSVSKGDVIRLNVDSVTTITGFTLIVHVEVT